MAHYVNIAVLFLTWHIQFSVSQILLCSLKLASEAFVAYELVPDMINNPPPDLVTIQFTSKTNFLVGDRTHVSEANQYEFLLWPCKQGALYTVIGVDPDVPSRNNPVDGEFLYALTINCPCSNVTAGDQVFVYTNVIPRNSIGCHRNTVLVYEQPGRIRYDSRELREVIEQQRINPIDSRYGFSTRKFVERNGLGDPIAGTFTITSYNGTTCAI